MHKLGIKLIEDSPQYLQGLLILAKDGCKLGHGQHATGNLVPEKCHSSNRLTGYQRHL